MSEVADRQDIRCEDAEQDASVLEFVVEHGAVTREEVGRAIGRLAAEDGVRRLLEAGLLHREGSLLVPSVAARVARTLDIG